MKKKVKSEKGKKIFTVTLCISIIMIVYSSIHIAIWIWDNYKANQEFQQIEKDVIITQPTSQEVLPEEKMVDEGEISNFDPYWNLIKLDYLEADFSNLIKTNQETVAWISVPNTNISYPIVQHRDNKYYLNHSFAGNQNEAGWIFMDYRNSIQNLGRNTIIYGHTRKDGSMFGTLENILNANWYEKEDNYAIKMSTQNENSLWQVFSVYCIPTTSDYIQTDFIDDVSFENFLNKIKERSVYDFKTNIGVKNKVLTLSTCRDKNERIVLHAKLIKSKKRI
ncbi:MAG: class B sortase [Clostridia bacterium]|nr:class B sortase [Clostridia bacterium]